jgi:hypothetical protein
MLSRLLELYRLVRDITRAGLTEQSKSSVEWTLLDLSMQYRKPRSYPFNLWRVRSEQLYNDAIARGLDISPA